MFTMGADQQHAKLMLRNGLSVIHWNGAELFKKEGQVAAGGNLEPDERLFIVTGSLSVNRYNDTESLQLIVSDVRDFTQSDDSKEKGATA